MLPGIRTTESYSLWLPDLTNEEIAHLQYETWQWPTSIYDVWYFVKNFNGEHQPLVHDYPVLLPLIVVPLYLAMVYFGQKFMAKRQAFKLDGLLKIWNLFLAILSVVMFLGLFQPMASLILDRGVRQLICLPEKDLLYGTPFCMIWIFCLSKYIELIDTVFLILRKRTVEFLHWYHHTTVLMYTWYSLVILSSPGSIFGCVNSFVHTFMYFYFFLTSCGYRPTWGKLITIIQIAQMLVGIAASTLWSYYYFVQDSCPVYANPHIYFLATLTLYGSYFLLFYQFYRKRYTPKSTSTKKPPTNNTSTQSKKEM